jgi:hypothetical protein
MPRACVQRTPESEANPRLLAGSAESVPCDGMCLYKRIARGLMTFHCAGQAIVIAVAEHTMSDSFAYVFESCLLSRATLWQPR